MTTSQPEFKPTCPSGGQWYACGTASKFVGCCVSDPCNDAGCSAGNLQPASFDAAYWGTEALPDQQCASTNAQWYTCAATDPTFMGCCTSNPCSTGTGCPQEDLIQGVLSGVTSAAERMDPQPPLSSDSSSDSSLSTGAIVGIVIGACALLLIAVTLLWWNRRRRNRKTMAMQSNDTPFSPKSHEKNHHYQDTPSSAPAYSPAPAYAFQQQHIIHEADSGDQTHPGYGLVPGSPPVHGQQRYSSTVSNNSTSPQVGSMSPYNTAPRPPQELGDHSVPLRGLGVQHLSPINQEPVELGNERDSPPAHDEGTNTPTAGQASGH